MGLRSLLSKFDLYKKVPEDFLKSSLSGAALSIAGLIVMALLFTLEFNAYLTPSISHKMVLGLYDILTFVFHVYKVSGT